MEPFQRQNISMIEIFQLGEALRSPSPRPSPPGRGRIAARLSASRGCLGLSQRWVSFSLSPGGTAGARARQFLTFLLLLTLPTRAADRPVSYYKDIVPIFKRSCTGCHHPGKLKGQLDLTTFEAFQKGGKDGPSFKAGNPKESSIIEEISGDEPSMPKEGDPLTKDEIAMIERWIVQGAKNDTPANANSFKLTEPPTYTAPPVISAMTYSPDGKTLAV